MFIHFKSALPYSLHTVWESRLAMKIKLITVVASCESAKSIFCERQASLSELRECAVAIYKLNCVFQNLVNCLAVYILHRQHHNCYGPLK